MMRNKLWPSWCSPSAAVSNKSTVPTSQQGAPAGWRSQMVA